MRCKENSFTLDYLIFFYHDFLSDYYYHEKKKRKYKAGFLVLKKLNDFIIKVNYVIIIIVGVCGTCF